ncbi:MAG: cobalamin 5'-phosphate synthase [Deltaproteobacteria bacterium GWC2_55_46]|nr:MAG: cobalamin 5'-phosphate synthase [Deltaproteobacteria bacterium GWA2_55_82]OGQ62336.1 MAG: cobalamin 5'-phosphate synthase [Deltaproteobacteria bacterium RIFCSPLOWO2_02_FULL_55_12]OIJ75134.1 MAG: cobalamin 5'-phosphate synthase [Deltaproteobacteria bacterium GWC2_55_46]
MKGFILALQFLTVFPVKKGVDATPEELGRSMGWFPAIGAVQGLILVAAYFILSTLLPESIVAGLLLLILVLTNGGLHVDGFADTVDGLAGGKTAQERLRIMRDSRIGAVGVLFVFFLLLIKFLALQELPAEVKPQAVFLFPVLGRWAMVPLAYLAPYARATGGLGAAFSGNSKGVLLKATVSTALIMALLLGLLSLVILAALWIIIYMSAGYFKRKIGGATGDVFGFHSEIAEVLFLLSVLAMTNMLSADLEE